MTQFDMTHLMSEHSRQLRFVIRQSEQSCVHIERPAGQSERIHALVRYGLHREWKPGARVWGASQPLYQSRKVVADLRIANDGLLLLDLRRRIASDVDVLLWRK